MGQPKWALARFEYISFLGRGGMGAVYEVFDRELGARMALKTVGFVEGQDLFRFKREFRAIRQLYHPHIVRLGELLELGGEWGYTMELVHGMDFVRYVVGALSPRVDSSRGASPHDAATEDRSGTRHTAARVGPLAGIAPGLPEQRLRRTLAQLAAALRFLHGHGRVHRDVKPSNVLVTSDERVVLLDFGLVKERSEERPHSEVIVLGTAAYMAPEQAAAQPVGPAADWYAVGVMLYEALTGRLPFEGPSADVLAAKQSGDPPHPREHRSELPADLVDLCMGLLARNPAERAGELEISACLLDAAGGAGVPAPQETRAREVVCLGREAERAALLRALEDVCNQRARWLLVHGPSGIGKTTLVEYFLEELASGEQRAPKAQLVLRSHCREYEEVSFKAFDEVFDSLSAAPERLEGLNLAGLRSEHAAALRRAFPVLQRVPAIARLTQAGGGDGDPKQLRMALYAGVRRLFRALGHAQTLVLVLEDMHWADADSWALVSELLRDQGAPPLLLVMTARCELLESERTPDDAREVLARTGLDKLAMTALEADTAARLVKLELARSPREDDALVRGILREAGGHPLLLSTMARHARARGTVGALTLAEVVHEELADLSAPARELVVAASLMGAPAERRAFAQALEMDAALLGELADQLVARKLLRAAGANGSALEPHHEQLRAAVLAQVSGADRIAWHRRLALALDRDSDARESAVHHYREAGDLRAASLAAERAAERAFQALAFDRAARLMEQSLAWCESASERARLTGRLAEALSYAGRSAEAAEAYLWACANAEGRTTLALRREAAVHLLSAGELTRGKALLAEALAELGLPMPGSTWAALARTLWLRARIRLRGTSYVIAQAPELSPDERSRLELYASTSTVLSTVDPILGHCFGSMYQLRALDSGDREHIARGLTTEGVYLCLTGDRARGSGLMAEARMAAGDSPSPYMAAFITANYAAVEWAYSEFRSALHSARSAHHEFATRCQRVSWELVTLELVETNALYFLGRYRELARRAASCLRAAEERGDGYGVTNMLVSQASVRFLAQDQPKEAHAAIERGAESWRGRNFDMQQLMALQSRIYVCLYGDEPERALALFEATRGAMARSLLLVLPAYRVLIWYVECQVRLAVVEEARGLPLSERRTQLARVRRLAHKLEHAAVPLGQAFAAIVLASWASREGRGPAFGRICEALTRLELLGLDGHAAALRLRASQAFDARAREATLLRDQGLRFMTKQDVKRPERFAHILVPSFELPARLLTTG